MVRRTTTEWQADAAGRTAAKTAAVTTFVMATSRVEAEGRAEGGRSKYSGHPGKARRRQVARRHHVMMRQAASALQAEVTGQKAVAVAEEAAASPAGTAGMEAGGRNDLPGRQG
jgi:hypothetical protein